MTAARGAVPPWPVSTPRPRITLTATCPVPDGAAAFAAALAADGWRTRTDGPGRVEATRTSWGNLLALAPPQRTTMVVDVRDTPGGCAITVEHPTLELGTPARRRSVAVLNDAVGRIERAGATVAVGAWEPGPR